MNVLTPSFPVPINLMAPPLIRLKKWLLPLWLHIFVFTPIYLNNIELPSNAVLAKGLTDFTSVAFLGAVRIHWKIKIVFELF